MSTSPSSDPLQSDISDAERYIEGILLSIISLVAVLGNASLWLVVLTTRSLRTESNYLLLCLSLADLLVSLVSMPVTVVTIFRSRWVFSRSTCQAMGFINMLTLVCSVMSLGLISLNRYIKICRPHVYRRVYTNRNIFLMSFGVWILSALLASPPVLGWSTYGYLPRQSFCFCDWATSVSYTFFMVGACFGGPLLMMSFSNLRILQTFRKSKKRVQPNQRPPPTSQKPLPIEQKPPPTAQKPPPTEQKPPPTAEKPPQEQQENSQTQKEQNKSNSLSVNQNWNRSGQTSLLEISDTVKAEHAHSQKQKAGFISNGLIAEVPKPPNSIILVAPANISKDNVNTDFQCGDSKHSEHLNGTKRYQNSQNFSPKSILTQSFKVSLESEKSATQIKDPQLSQHENICFSEKEQLLTKTKGARGSKAEDVCKTSSGFEHSGPNFDHPRDTLDKICGPANTKNGLETANGLSKSVPLLTSILQVPDNSTFPRARTSSMTSQNGARRITKPQSLTFILPAGSKESDEGCVDGAGNLSQNGNTWQSETAVFQNGSMVSQSDFSENHSGQALLQTEPVIFQNGSATGRVSQTGCITQTGSATQTGTIQTGSVTQTGNGKAPEAGQSVTQSQTSLVRAMRAQKREKRRNEEFQLALSLMVVIVVFVICWLPFCITMFLTVFASDTLSRAPDIFTLMLGYSNSCLNPIIYGVMNKNVQEAYKKMARKFVGCGFCRGDRDGMRAAVSTVDTPPSISTTTKY